MRFTEELEELLKKYSQSERSNTPDFILAKYITHCLLGFNEAVVSRDEWNKNDEHNLLKNKYNL